MSRPQLGSLLSLALVLGLGVGCLEVGLRSSPRLGMNLAEVGIWLSVSAGLSAFYLVLVAVVAWAIGRWVHGQCDWACG